MRVPPQVEDLSVPVAWVNQARVLNRVEPARRAGSELTIIFSRPIVKGNLGDFRKMGGRR
jgi:hypothetical protein